MDKKTINVKSYFESSNVDIKSIQRIYYDIIHNSELLQSEDNLSIKKRIEKQDMKSYLILSDEEEDVVIYLIGEVVFSVNMIMNMDKTTHLDFSGLLPVLKNENYLLFDIKTHLINSLLDVCLNLADKAVETKNYNIPEKYNEMIYKRIEKYIAI